MQSVTHTPRRAAAPFKWARLALTAVLLAGASLIGVSFADEPEAEAASTPELVFTLDGNRNNSQTLDGARIAASENVGIFISPRFHPAIRVEFFLNGQKVQTERLAPWDLSGTNAFGGVNSLWSTDLREGTNTVEARIRGYFWRNSTLRATFTREAVDSSTAGGFNLDFSETNAILDSYVRDENLNGAGLVVVHPDHGIVHETYMGEIDENRISLIASSNKLISAGVLLNLADNDPNFAIDAPLSEAVPWSGDLADVTPEQLLSNSSGLPGLLSAYLFGALCAVNVNSELERCGQLIANNTLDDFLQIGPDQEFRYGGPQWQVAGAVAETVSGKDWAQLIEDIYREPCDLDVLGYTNLGQGRLFTEGLPYPAAFDLNHLVPTANPIIEGGGYTTPRDYAKILQMMISGGKCGDTQVLSEESLERMTTDRIGPAYGGQAQGRGYGLGMFTEDGLATDPGAFGALPWIDLDDGFAAYFVIEHISLPGQGGRTDLVASVEEAMQASSLELSPVFAD